ncbi:Bacteriophage holin family protein [Maribacter dokdonensis]|uniref:Bacteriophage holin family protein n=1 Tax=Maribacter dokdonensis TaxID=320912 RepID=A0ABY0V0M3_9FLAO|nr:phage holin family protein [Maribacter dokdonensis]SDT47419.1 Bacteriophage holin family protein [Maribacter dokdonensis]
MYEYKDLITKIELLLVAVLTYLGINKNAAGVLFLLMVLDTFAGGLKAIILKEGFTFKKMAAGIASKLSVLVVPLTIALLGRGMSFDFSMFLLMIMNILLVGETFSILTNILSIKKRESIKNFDFITLVISTIRNSMYNIFKQMLSKIENFKA